MTYNKLYVRPTLTYLACPYTHADKEVSQKRFDEVTNAAIFLLKRNIHVFSPISYNGNWPNLPGDWDFWESVDMNFISRCDALAVYKLDGWEKSKGVAAEVSFAISLELPVLYITVEELYNGFFEKLIDQNVKGRV